MVSYCLMKNNNTAHNSRINISDSIRRAAKARLPEVIDALTANSRLRSSRWPGMTSLYDSHRMLNLIEDLSHGSSVTWSRVFSLQFEVSTFKAVLGPQLYRALDTLDSQA